MSASAGPSWPVIGDGYQADLQVTNAHLWLFAEVYCLGYLAVVFDVNRKLKVAVQDATDLEDAKKKAEGYAAGYLRYLGAGDLPDIHWDPNPRNRTTQPRRLRGFN
ncbi:MAG TPA: hypothetical protein VI431_13665 [Candidatus Acidoferrum sp.]